MERIDAFELQLLDCLRESREPVSAQDLAGRLSVSSKTVRNHLKALDRTLKSCGAAVRSKNGVGYWLEIADPDALEESLQSIREETPVRTPSSGRRLHVHRLIRCLLCQKDYIRIEALDEMLYTNRTTVRQLQGEAGRKLAIFDLHIESKNRQGIRVVGQEANLRLCLCREADLLWRSYAGEGNGEEYTRRYPMGDETEDALRELVCRRLGRLENLSSYGGRYLARLIRISALRNQMGLTLRAGDQRIREFKGGALYKPVKALLEECGRVLDHTFLPEDAAMLTVAAEGFRVAVRRQDLDLRTYRIGRHLAQEVLEELGRRNGFTVLNKDEILLEELALTLPGIFFRSQHRIITGQFTQEDSSNCSLMAKKLAMQTVDFLRSKYGVYINEDETLGLVPVIRPVFGRYPRRGHKLRACCISMANKSVGKGTAERLRRNFDRYLKELDVLEPYELYDAHAPYEVVFTDYPREKLPPLDAGTTYIPVAPFFDEEDKQRIRKLLVALSTDGEVDNSRYLQDRLIFSDVEGGDQAGCIRSVERLLREAAGADDRLAEDLLFCERLSPSVLREGVAFLSGLDAHIPGVTVAVFVLKKAVRWGESGKAQVLIYWDQGTVERPKGVFENEFLPHLLEITFNSRQLVNQMLKAPDREAIVARMSEKDKHIMTEGASF